MAFTHLQTSFLKSVTALVPLSDYDTAKEPGLNWEAIQAEAKTNWLAGVVEGLDNKSAQTMSDLATAYETATMKFSDANAIVKPKFTISLTADEQKEFWPRARAVRTTRGRAAPTTSSTSSRRCSAEAAPAPTGAAPTPTWTSRPRSPAPTAVPPGPTSPPAPTFRTPRTSSRRTRSPARAAAPRGQAASRPCPPDHVSTPRRAPSPMRGASRSPARTAGPWSYRPARRWGRAVRSSRRPRPVSRRGRPCRTAPPPGA